MKPKDTEFYRYIFNEIYKKRRINAPDAQIFEDKIFGLLEKDIESSSKIKYIEEQVSRISGKLNVFERVILKEAREFYKDFPVDNEELKKSKNQLTQHYKAYALSKKLENHKQAATWVCIQLEGFFYWFEQFIIKCNGEEPECEHPEYDSIHWRRVVDSQKLRISTPPSYEFKSKCFYLPCSLFNQTRFVIPKEYYNYAECKRLRIGRSSINAIGTAIKSVYDLRNAYAHWNNDNAEKAKRTLENYINFNNSQTVLDYIQEVMQNSFYRYMTVEASKLP